LKKEAFKGRGRNGPAFLNFGELLSVLVEHLDGQKAAICKPFTEKMVGIW
jgi:hypothetical protein